MSRLTATDLARLDVVVHAMELTGQIGDAVRLVEQDIEFHRVLTASCQRPVLLEALGAISNKTYLLITATRYAYPLDRLAELHAWILQAVRSGDPDRLEAAVRDHIAYGQHILVKSLGGRGDAAAGHLAALPPSVEREYETSHIAREG
jgi:DNA-binding FadR family transcriptional regulator